MVGNTLLTNLGKSTGKMTDWPTEWDTGNAMNDAWAADERQPQGFAIYPKVAPSFDGRISWFSFAEAIDDWLDITTVAPDKWAPSFRARLVGYCQHVQPPFGQRKIEISK